MRATIGFKYDDWLAAPNPTAPKAKARRYSDEGSRDDRFNGLTDHASNANGALDSRVGYSNPSGGLSRRRAPSAPAQPYAHATDGNPSFKIAFNKLAVENRPETVTPRSTAGTSVSNTRHRLSRLMDRSGKPLTVACVYGGMGDAHRVHQASSQAKMKQLFGAGVEIKPIDLKITGIVRDAALQRNYDMTSADPNLNELHWQKQLKTPQMQRMIKDVGRFFDETKPDVVFSNYDTIARLAMDRMKAEYKEDRPPMVQHLSDLGRMHPRWILSEFKEKNSKDVVLTAGKAIRPGQSDQRQFVLEQGVPPKNVIHTGAPVRDDFHDVRKMSKQACREELKRDHGIVIPEDKMSFVIMSGTGHWPQKLLAATSALANAADLKDKIYIVPIAGRHESTKEALRKLIPKSIDILGYTVGRKLALLQGAVGLNCIKYGGASIPDVVAANRPLMGIDALSGPEPENARFVEEQGIGLDGLITANEDGSMNVDKFMKEIRRVVDNPKILDEIQEAQKPHIVENSAEMIANVVVRKGVEHLEAKINRQTVLGLS